MTDEAAAAVLAEHEGRLLPPLARAEVVRALGGTPAPLAASAPFLEEPRATFVTLKCDGVLRGCVGRLEAIRPLLADVQANARAAAFEDPRFEPLSLAELAGTSFSVSVLSPLAPLAVADEDELLSRLEPGRHGVVLEWRHQRATFLPQVWSDLPGGRDFLRHLKLKAGLPGDFWSSELAFASYSVQSWSEQAIEAPPSQSVRRT